MPHDTITRFLRASRANRIILQCTEGGQYEASAHKIALRLCVVEAPNRDAALASLEVVLEEIYPPPTVPNNELPEPAPETLKPAEASDV
jgi:hypothetical protein